MTLEVDRRSKKLEEFDAVVDGVQEGISPTHSQGTNVAVPPTIRNENKVVKGFSMNAMYANDILVVIGENTTLKRHELQNCHFTISS